MRAITRWSSLTRPVGETETLADEDVIAMLSRRVEAATKADLPGWAPARFTNGRRSLATWESSSLIGVDVDRGDLSPGDLIATYGRWYGYGHATPSSRPGARRWRVFLFLQTPLEDAQDARRVLRWAHGLLPGLTDTATHDPSRLWFLPWSGAAHWDHFGLAGEALDGAAIAADARAEEARARAARPPAFRAPRTVSAHASLRRAVEAIHRATEGERHATIVREAWLVGRRVGAGELDLETARGELEAAGLAVLPGRASEVRRSVAQQLAEGASVPWEGPTRWL